MAECFCGCGRKVRFEKKRMSRFGQDTVRRIAALEAAIPKIGDPMYQGIAKKQLENGRKFAAIWEGLVHGRYRCPAGRGWP